MYTANSRPLMFELRTNAVTWTQKRHDIKLLALRRNPGFTPHVEMVHVSSRVRIPAFLRCRHEIFKTDAHTGGPAQLHRVPSRAASAMLHGNGRVVRKESRSEGYSSWGYFYRVCKTRTMADVTIAIAARCSPKRRNTTRCLM